METRAHSRAATSRAAVHGITSFCSRSCRCYRARMKLLHLLHAQELKTHEFGIYKKKVAQLMTVAREKDIAEQGNGDDAPSLRDRRRQEKCVLRCPALRHGPLVEMLPRPFSSAFVHCNKMRGLSCICCCLRRWLTRGPTDAGSRRSPSGLGSSNAWRCRCPALLQILCLAASDFAAWRGSANLVIRHYDVGFHHATHRSACKLAARSLRTQTGTAAGKSSINACWLVLSSPLLLRTRTPCSNSTRHNALATLLTPEM